MVHGEKMTDGGERKLVFENVWKRYRREIVLRNLNYHVCDGEFFVLFGPTGAGKTTTLKIIAGLELVSAGELHMNGKQITFDAPQERNTRMVFETYALYPHLTVFENIASPLRAKRISDGHIKTRVQDMADLLGIGTLLNRLPRELSGGQKQRVALGRSLVMESELYLLDEPLAHLDAKIRNELRAEFHNIKSFLGKATVIYVTHDYLEAMSLAERVCVLNKGTVEQLGTPREIYSNPANIFVAEVMGQPEINMFEMELSRAGDNILVRDTDMELNLPPRLVSLLSSYKKTKIIVGLRPQFFKAETNGGGNNGESFQARVDTFEIANYRGIILAKTGKREFSILCESYEQMDEGLAISVHPDLNHAVLFDPETGINLSTVS